MMTGIARSATGNASVDKQALLEEWAEKLNLGQWLITLGTFVDDGPQGILGEDAYVNKEIRERVASIHITPHATDEQYPRLLVHELLHLVLTDMERFAMNDRPAAIMDIVDIEQERVINDLSTALTGIEYSRVRSHESADDDQEG